MVVGLLRRAAEQAALIGEHARVNALLAGALGLIDPGESAMLIDAHTGRHAALYGLGRLEEADEEYRTIESLSATAMDRTDTTVVQLSSLTQRNRVTEAIALGSDSLRELGIAVPAADRLPAELDHQFDHLYRWLDHTDGADDLARPDLTDPRLLAATRVLYAVLPANYLIGDQATFAWLSLEALRIWIDHGPGRTLVGAVSLAAFNAVALRGDYPAGYRAARRILELSEARGYEPETSQARFTFSLLSCWSEPIEHGVQAAQRAREGLIAGGDPHMAGHANAMVMDYLVDCAPTLDSFAAELDAGLAFVRRSGHEQAGQQLDAYRWLAAVLRGESGRAAGAADHTDRYADTPVGLAYAHVIHATAAAIFGDLDALRQHAAAAMPLLQTAPGPYPLAAGHLLHGLALAGQARDGHGDERGGLLSELDEVTRWLAARAADAPDNFLHLQRLLEAERAWALGDFWTAVLAFDAARREVAQRERPWHRALIAERAGRFYLAHGVEHAGYDLIAQARRELPRLGRDREGRPARLGLPHPATTTRRDRRARRSAP